MFIEIENGVLSITSSRSCAAVAGDLEDMILCIEDGTDEHLTIIADGVYAALQDCDYLEKIKADHDAVETLFNFLSENQ